MKKWHYAAIAAAVIVVVLAAAFFFGDTEAPQEPTAPTALSVQPTDPSGTKPADPSETQPAAPICRASSRRQKSRRRARFA